MNNWRYEMESALGAFIAVAELAGEVMKLSELTIEYLNAPHQPPTKLPNGRMAVYAFWWNDIWLKVGKAGRNSNARYTFQHYNVRSAQSTLAGSLANDLQMSQVIGFDKLDPGKWIKASTCRVNILVSSNRRRELLSLLEAFLHVRLNPKYEG